MTRKILLVCGLLFLVLGAMGWGVQWWKPEGIPPLPFGLERWEGWLFLAVPLVTGLVLVGFGARRSTQERQKLAKEIEPILERKLEEHMVVFVDFLKQATNRELQGLTVVSQELSEQLGKDGLRLRNGLEREKSALLEALLSLYDYQRRLGSLMGDDEQGRLFSTRQSQAFQEICKEHGLVPFEPEAGAAFSAHDSVVESVRKQGPGSFLRVWTVVEPGWKFHGQLVRKARVVATEGEEK
ncbi:MAG TPA: hypothetical protein P5560_01315 [Thermotogota bacterium]|nr:hypothetical protein [Thermotogota bacterium]HRW91567.1 hypothetical protein [Thermotogota bacterium]